MQEGKCPKCGGSLEYPDGFNTEYIGEGELTYEVVCDKCEWSGTEIHEIKFKEFRD